MPKVIGDMKLYDLHELHEIIGVSEVSLRKYLRDGKLTGRKLGTRWFVTEESLKDYFNKADTE